MMLKFFLSLMVCNLSSSFVLGQKDQDLARVQKIQGVESYILCEPLREYEVVFNEKTGLKMTSLLTGGLVNESVSDKANQFVQRVVKEGAKNGVRFDAVIYFSGKSAVAVRFKDEATPETKGIGRVKKINGSAAFILSEPVAEYEVAGQKSGGVKWKSYLTGGLVNNSIEEDVEQFITRIRKSGMNIDGVLYSGGKTAVGLIFK